MNPSDSASWLQVAAPDGSTAADVELKPGRLFVVPAFFPHAQKVGSILWYTLL